MSYDATSIGICLGLVSAVSFVGFNACRRRSPELRTGVTLFLAGFALPGATMLIAAGISGDQMDLPTSWRQHVGVAGVVMLWLSGDILLKRLMEAWSRSAKTGSDDETKPQPSRKQRAS